MRARSSPATARRRHQQGRRQLEPGHRPPAAPPPSPPRRKARNELKPAAAFRVTASRTRLRHPGPAPIGDLDPDHGVRRLDRDRHRLTGSARAAMPHAVAEKLAHQQGGGVPARVPGPSTPPTNARATRARSARPASVTVSRTASPAISAPAFPAALAPGNHAGRRTDTPGCTPDSAAHVKPGHAPGTGTGTPSSGYPHRSLAPIPVRYASVDTATQRPTALQGDTPRDREKRPASARIRS